MSHSYFLRLTPRATLSFEDIITVIDSLSITRYLICYEEASRPHYHLCLWSDRSVENLRYRIKSQINAELYLSGKHIEDKIKAIAYCIKDGNYRQQGINALDLIMAKTITKKKATFEQDLHELDLTGSKEQILGKLLDLYVKYNRKIYIQHIRAHLDLILLKKDKSYREILIQKILY